MSPAPHKSKRRRLTGVRGFEGERSDSDRLGGDAQFGSPCLTRSSRAVHFGWPLGTFCGVANPRSTRWARYGQMVFQCSSHFLENMSQPLLQTHRVLLNFFFFALKMFYVFLLFCMHGSPGAILPENIKNR